MNNLDQMKNYVRKVSLVIFMALSVSSVAFSQQELNWTFKTNGRIFGTPFVDSENIYIGSGDHKLYAISRDSGLKNWDYTTGGAVHSSPLLHEDNVVFGSEDGFLYALDKNNGKMVWKFGSKGEKMYGPWDYYLSSPREDDGLIYWGSGDGNIYAIEAKTGKLVWKYQTGDIIHADPIIHQDKVFIGSFDGNLYALNKKSGELVWKFKTLGAQYFPKGEIQKAVLVDQGTVYFGSRDYNLYAFDETTGKVKWNMREPAGWIIATPVVFGDQIFFGTSDAHKFYSMNKNSGAKEWVLDLRMRVFGSGVVRYDHIYFGTFDGKMIAAEIKTGIEKWEFQTKGSKENYASIFDASGNFINSFQLYGKDMKQTERMILDLGAILSTPVISQNTLYFGSADGNVYAVNLQD